jgi:hypothetical protein
LTFFGRFRSPLFLSFHVSQSSDYVIPNPADCFVEAFVIAENKNNSDLTFEEDEVDKVGSKEDRSQSDERSSGGAMAIAAAAAARGLGFSSTHGSRGYPSPPPSPSSSQRRSQVRSSASYGDDGMDEPTAVPLEYEWKSLLRKYQSGGPMMISSSEELESRVEKEFARNNFFTTLPVMWILVQEYPVFLRKLVVFPDIF